MITRQLQENWRSSKTRFIPEKLIFEVTDASVVHDTNSKYVVSTPTPAVNRSSPVSRTIFQSVFNVTKWEEDTLDCSHQRKGKDL